MASLSLTTQEKLRGKWIFFAVAVVILLGILPILLNGFVGIYISPETLKIHDLSVFRYFGTDRFAEFFCNELRGTFFRRSLPTVILLSAPLWQLLIYLVEGHKRRRGTVLLSLSMAMLALWPLFLFANTPYKTGFVTEFYELVNYILGIFPSGWSFLVLFIVLLSAALCLAAALSVLLIPKVGRFVAIGCLGVNLLLPFAAASTSAFIDQRVHLILNSQSYLAYMAPCVTLFLISVLLIVLLLINRIPVAFGKAAQTATIAVASEIASADSVAEETTKTVAKELPTVQEEAQREKISPVASVYDADMLALYKLRTNGEISAEEYRRLRDLLDNDQ